MLNLIQADLFKVRKSMAIKVLFGISTVSAAVMIWFAFLISQGTLEKSFSGLGFMFSDINVISILGGIVASILICGDFENKTIHDSIANGWSRSFIVLSKTSLIGICLAFLLLPYALLTFVALSTGSEYSMGAVGVGFLNVLATESGSVLSAGEVWKMMAVMLSLMLVYAAQVSICVPLAFLLKKPVLVVGMYYGLSVSSGQLLSLSQSSPVFDRIFSLTPFGGHHVFLTLTSGAGDIIKSILVSLCFITIMITITSGIFRKAEIK
jgi:ABC-2 type transport system permease protein